MSKLRTVPKIEELIDKALVRKDRERSGKFNPSSFGYCFRAQFWNRKNEPKTNPPDARTIRVFEAGRLFEKFVTDLILQDKDYRTQVKVETEDILGYADLVGADNVIDVKSQHSKSFWYLAKKGFDVRVEKRANWLQVMYYALALSKPQGTLVFLSKDDLCIEQYTEPLDKYWTDMLDAELATLRGYWERNELPPANPRNWPHKDKKSGEITWRECEWCGWHSLCNNIEGK